MKNEAPQLIRAEDQAAVDKKLVGHSTAPERPAEQTTDLASAAAEARGRVSPSHISNLESQRQKLEDVIVAAHADPTKGGQYIAGLESQLDELNESLAEARVGSLGVFKKDTNGALIPSNLETRPTGTAPGDGEDSARVRLAQGVDRSPKTRRLKSAVRRVQKAGNAAGDLLIDGVERTRKSKVVRKIGDTSVKSVVRFERKKRTPEVKESGETQWTIELERLQKMAERHNIPLEKLVSANADLQRDKYAEIIAKHAGSAFAKGKELERARVAYETAVNASGVVTAVALQEAGMGDRIAELSIMGNLGWDEIHENGDRTPVEGEEEKLVNQICKFKQLRAGGRAHLTSMRLRYGAEMTRGVRDSDDADFVELATFRPLHEVEDAKGLAALKQNMYNTWQRWGETKKGKTARFAIMAGAGAGLGLLGALTAGSGTVVAATLMSARVSRLIATTKLERGSKLTLAEAEAFTAKEDIARRREAQNPNFAVADMVDKYNQETVEARKRNLRRTLTTAAITAAGVGGGALLHSVVDHFTGGGVHHEPSATQNHQPAGNNVLSDRQEIEHLKQLQGQHELANLANAHEIHTGGNSTVYESFSKAGIHFDKVMEMAQHAQHAGEIREVRMPNGSFYFEAHTPQGWSDNTNEVAKALMKHAAQAGVRGNYRLAA